MEMYDNTRDQTAKLTLHIEVNNMLKDVILDIIDKENELFHGLCEEAISNGKFTSDKNILIDLYPIAFQKLLKKEILTNKQ